MVSEERSTAAKKDVVVHKKLNSKLSVEDLKILRLVEEAWRDLEKGRYKIRSKEEFFKELRQW
jgi:hypothetical protein